MTLLHDGSSYRGGHFGQQSVTVPVEVTFDMAAYKRCLARDARRETIVGFLRDLDSDGAFSEEFLAGVTAYTIVLLPEAVYNAEPRLPELGFVRAHCVDECSVYVVDSTKINALTFL
ncbi:hypothetical protein [Billgrantia desiderata]|uniref:hypothetical protein n=1 Tax=Billgrantia desiderata TaxID=52021 RepID=UPI001F3AAE6E|nr:hypothetical protein [Halomonas desiderata]MCE8012919.1 hypothetical protein [Halomonas desiderata]